MWDVLQRKGWGENRFSREAKQTSRMHLIQLERDIAFTNCLQATENSHGGVPAYFQGDEERLSPVPLL